MAGFGEELFAGFFEDDTTKKPAVIPAVPVAPVAAIAQAIPVAPVAPIAPVVLKAPIVPAVPVIPVATISKVPLAVIPVQAPEIINLVMSDVKKPVESAIDDISFDENENEVDVIKPIVNVIATGEKIAEIPVKEEVLEVAASAPVKIQVPEAPVAENEIIAPIAVETVLTGEVAVPVTDAIKPVVADEEEGLIEGIVNTFIGDDDESSEELRFVFLIIWLFNSIKYFHYYYRDDFPVKQVEEINDDDDDEGKWKVKII